jgi:hypothetical protein
MKNVVVTCISGILASALILGAVGDIENTLAKDGTNFFAVLR